MVSLRDVFEVRLQAFDDEFCWNNEQDCVLRGFMAMGEWTALVFGEEKAADLMQAVADSMSATGARLDIDNWREDWLAAEQTIWPAFFDDLLDLNAFAQLGIFRPCRFAEEREMTADERSRLDRQGDIADWVRERAALIGKFFKLAPEPEGYGAIYDALWRVRDKALARLNFDEGVPLTAQELALLSGVSLKRVQNAAYEKGEGGPVMNKHGRIEREGAMEWLTRKDFKFSIWQQIAALGPLSAGWGRDVSVDPALVINDDIAEEGMEVEDDYVFVPVAADRTRFEPSAQREQGYQIGAKGAEVYIADYFEALDALSRQATPRWRRPNEAGNWGIVSGVTWERIRRSDLIRSAR